MLDTMCLSIQTYLSTFSHLEQKADLIQGNMLDIFVTPDLTPFVTPTVSPFVTPDLTPFVTPDLTFLVTSCDSLHESIRNTENIKNWYFLSGYTNC